MLSDHAKSALGKFFNGSILRAGPVEVLHRGYGVLPIGARYLYYLAFEEQAVDVIGYLKKCDIYERSSFSEFLCAIPGASLYDSTVYIFGADNLPERRPENQYWSALSIAFENEINPYPLKGCALVGAISCYERKFDISIDQNGLVALLSAGCIWKPGRIDFLELSLFIDSLISQEITDSGLNDLSVIKIERQLIALF